MERAAVWRLLLRKSHEDAERHYLPVGVAAKELTRAMMQLASPPIPADDPTLSWRRFGSCSRRGIARSNLVTGCSM